jgi:CheY-like chemotaxis protein
MRRESRGMGEPKHVLYVDDDEDMSFLSEIHLTDEGYRVTCVGNGEAAVELLRAQGAQVDVVVADYQMPGLSGAELAGLCAKDHPGLPVILASAYVDTDRSQEAREAGAIALVLKTPDNAPLLACLAALAAKRGWT